MSFGEISIVDESLTNCCRTDARKFRMPAVFE